ncbi:MAG: glycosyltransferase family 4 protein [Proteobacteria bacterium]|nr:glycosyltransferase family 4 protein [Pseudomonadota bacterium]
MKSILVLLHCGSNTGYAIGPLERTFFDMARALCNQDVTRIHFAYPSMANGPSPTLPPDFKQYALVDSRSTDPEHWKKAEHYICDHDIDTIFGFDQPVARPIYRYFRRAGVKNFISYWGAPMSSMNNLAVRLVKRFGVTLRLSGPNHYIFESQGMAELAIKGRGVPRGRCAVVPLGIDCDRYRPDPVDAQYAYDCFGIPERRRIFFYSGHMEPRKGVAVIMTAANCLSESRKADDWHILLCGNKGGESRPYEQMLKEGASAHVTFAGYRSDLEVLCRSCYAALIMSTGWDSFPRSGLEVQASGLPLIVSDLRGIRESVRDGFTGLIVKAGDGQALAGAMNRLLDDRDWRDQLSRQARARIEAEYTIDKQLSTLTDVVRGMLL